MTLSKINQDLEYFQQEMEYIKYMSTLFAQQYPKVARRLELTSDNITDPHVARLVESFAYVSSKLNREIEDEFPRITTSLLSVLYPQYVSPIPSMSVAQFQVSPELASSTTTAKKIPKETSLFTQAEGGVTCRFQTCYAMDLWPIVIDDVSILPSSAYTFSPTQIDQISSKILRIRLKSLSLPFGSLNMNTLRFYIQGSMDKRQVLLEALFRSSQLIALAKDTSMQPIILPQSSLGMVGFKTEESVLPTTELLHDAYRLIQEFFSFPSKYFFFDVNGLDFTSFAKEETVDLLIGINAESLSQGFSVDKGNVLYGCTPIVNIFKTLAEPISLNHRQSEYPLISNIRDEMTQEVHTILSVHSFDPDTGNTSYHAPYFFFSDKEIQNNQKLFWTSRRTSSNVLNMPGTRVQLGFVTLDLKPATLGTETVYVDTLCTNRELAAQIIGNTLLNIEEMASLGDIVCLDAPTMPIYPENEGAYGWKLITQMALNKLSFSSDPKSLNALKEMLLVHTQLSGFEMSPYIDTMLSMRTFPVVRRFGQDAWRGFVKGQGVEIIVQDNYSEEYNPFLMTAVLQHFFKLYVGFNTFVQLSVKKRGTDEICVQWPALEGSVQIA